MIQTYNTREQFHNTREQLEKEFWELAEMAGLSAVVQMLIDDMTPARLGKLTQTLYAYSPKARMIQTAMRYLMCPQIGLNGVEARGIVDAALAAGQPASEEDLVRRCLELWGRGRRYEGMAGATAREDYLRKAYPDGGNGNGR